MISPAFPVPILVLSWDTPVAIPLSFDGGEGRASCHPKFAPQLFTFLNVTLYLGRGHSACLADLGYIPLDETGVSHGRRDVVNSFRHLVAAR